jgi:hypothetical protein
MVALAYLLQLLELQLHMVEVEVGDRAASMELRLLAVEQVTELAREQQILAEEVRTAHHQEVLEEVALWLPFILITVRPLSGRLGALQQQHIHRTKTPLVSTLLVQPIATQVQR